MKEGYLILITALHIATEKGNYIICKILIWDFNADINLKTKDNLTALKLAKKGEVIKKQLEYKSIIELLKDYMSKTQENYKNGNYFNKNKESMIKCYGGNFKEDKYFIVTI